MLRSKRFNLVTELITYSLTWNLIYKENFPKTVISIYIRNIWFHGRRIVSLFLVKFRGGTIDIVEEMLLLSLKVYSKILVLNLAFNNRESELNFTCNNREREFNLVCNNREREHSLQKIFRNFSTEK